MIQVVNFILDPRVGGPHVYVNTVTNALKSKITSILVTAGRGPVTDIPLINLRHRWYGAYPLEVLINFGLILWLALIKRIPRQGVIFDVHGAANLAPILAARALGIPVVWHFHETWAKFKPFVRLGRWILRNTSHRLVVVANKAATVFGLDRYLVLSAAVDIEFWSCTAEEDVRGSQDRRLNIVSIGNLNPLKGHDILLSALEEFRHPYSLIIVGATLQNQLSYFEDLRKQADTICRNFPDASIEFRGWAVRDEIRDLLLKSDVFVLPSRSEACPIALLEAMAMECTCIASDVGGVSEIIDDASYGYIVKAENPIAIRTALESVCDLAEQEQLAIGKAARTRILAEYSAIRIAGMHMELYQELLGEAYSRDSATDRRKG